MSKKRKKSPGASIEKRKTPKFEKRKKSKTANKSPPTTFFDLAAELRNEIYDMSITPFIKEQKGSYYPLVGEIGIESPIAINRRSLPVLSKVCRQMRYEFLPIYHRYQPLNLDWNFSCNAELTERWLGVFGETRVPLTRNFVLGIIPRVFNSVVIDLSRGLHVSWSCGYYWGQGALEYGLKITEFVESQLHENEAGRYLTAEGLRAIVKFASEVGGK